MTKLPRFYTVPPHHCLVKRTFSSKPNEPIIRERQLVLTKRLYCFKYPVPQASHFFPEHGTRVHLMRLAQQRNLYDYLCLPKASLPMSIFVWRLF